MTQAAEKAAKIFGVQDGRVDPGNDHVQGHGQRAAAQALDEASRDQDRHGSGGAGDEQAEHEHDRTATTSGATGPRRSDQLPAATMPITPGGERAGEGERVEACAVEFAAHDAA